MGKFKLISLILLIVLASTLVSAFDRTILLPTTYINTSYQNISVFNDTYWNETSNDLINTNTGTVNISNNLYVDGMTHIDDGILVDDGGYLNFYNGYTGKGFDWFIWDGTQYRRSLQIKPSIADFQNYDIATTGIINTTGNIYGADVYSNGIKLENFNTTYLFNATRVLRYNNNTIVIYNPISYYKEETTAGEIQFIAPYMLDNGIITYEVEQRTRGHRTIGTYVLTTQVTNGVVNQSTMTVVRNVLSNNGFSNSFDRVGFITASGILGIGAGNSFFSPGTYTDLEIIIRRVTISGTNTSLDWGNNWTINIITAPFTTPTHNVGYAVDIWNSDNDGIGSYLNADLLDGKSSENFFSSNSISQWTNFSDQAISPGMWKGTNINDSAYFPNTASGNRSNIFLIGDVLADGKYTHQIECKAFQDECSLRAAGSAVGVRDWIGIVTATYLYNTSFTGDHTQIGNINISETLYANEIEATGKITSEEHYVDRTNNVLLTSVNVNNTVVETTIYTGEQPANSLTVGEITKIWASGTVNTNSASDSFIMRFKLGNLTKFNFTLTPKKLTNDIWDLHGIATQRTLGATGQRATHLHFEIEDSTDEGILEGVGALDTTSNMNLTITIEWNIANADNIFIINQAFMEFKN